MKRNTISTKGLLFLVLPVLITIFSQSVTPQGKGVTEEIARSLIRTHLNSAASKAKSSDLRLARSFGSVLGSHFVFEQLYRGVPVEGGQTSVHFNQSGAIIASTDSYREGINIDTIEPLVERDAAIQSVRLGAEARAYRPSAELIIHEYKGEYRLAWKVDVPTDGPTWEFYIDARDGQQLGDPQDINFYADGMGQVFRDNAVVATQDNTLTDQKDAASAVPASAYMIVALPGLFGNGFLDGEFASSSSSKKRVFSLSNTFLFDRSSDGFSETMGYFYLDYAERYIQSLGFANVNARQQIFSVNRSKIDNSFYSPSTKEITYGTGGVDDAEDAEVILHEYGHSIQDNQVPGWGGSHDAFSMGEGFGDYFSASVTSQFSNGFQNECLAEWDATSYSPFIPPCLRVLSSTKHYPEDIDGEIHDDGEIWSAALWQVRGAIGAEKADRAVIAAHFLLAPGASFNDGANALITAAVNLRYSNNEVRTIRRILTDRGFAPSV